MSTHFNEPNHLSLTDKQRRVFESAIDIFAEKGFAQTSTSEIAARAQVAEGTVFKRYATKKDLLMEIGLSVAAQVSIPLQLKEMQEILDGPFEAVEDLLKAFLRNQLELALKNRNLLRVLVQEMPFHPELQRIVLDQVVPTMLPIATQVITRFQRARQLRDLPPSTLLRMISSQFLSYVMMRVILNPHAKWNDAAEIERIVSVLMDGMRAR